jgi:L-alanine-DL-glutamate epimerase-like enolase superfamily enzyme
MPGYSLDTLAEVDRALDRAVSSRELEVVARDGDLQALGRASDRIAEVSPAAACGLETAVLDWIAQRMQVSVAELLADGAPIREVAVNRVATPVDLATGALATQARVAWDAGYRTFKLKVARPASESAELAAADWLRANFPDQMELRLDANGGWAPAEFEPLLARFSAFSPSFCEQPTPVGTLSSLPTTPVPFAADESCRNSDEVHQLLLPSPHPSLAALVLKPMALGGALRCLAIAQAAARAGVPIVVTHLLDGPVSAAISAELAAALPGEVLACGLAGHPNLTSWGVDVPQLRGPLAGSAGRPGLGIVLESVPT